MSPAPHKDVEIRGAKYRIGRVSASDGAWLLSLFSSKFNERKRQQEETRPAAAAAPEKPAAAEPSPEAVEGRLDAMARDMANFVLTQLSRAQIAEVQTLCLEACAKYDATTGTSLPMPLMDSGRFAVKGLEHDAPTVLEITRETLAYNLSPFFSVSPSSPATSGS